MIATASITEPTLDTPSTLADRVRVCLNRMGYPQLKAVDCCSEGDSILLSGEIDSFYMKQIAQEAATRTPGVGSVRNEIEVV